MIEYRQIIARNRKAARTRQRLAFHRKLRMIQKDADQSFLELYGLQTDGEINIPSEIKE